MRGIEQAIANRDLWSIDVLNISIGDCAPSNGLNAAAQLINTAVSLGLVVVVPAGNVTTSCAPVGNVLINNWASASLAITVGAVEDNDTVRSETMCWPASPCAVPRLSDGDADPRDEQKAEISAPGASILSARATRRPMRSNLPAARHGNIAAHPPPD